MGINLSVSPDLLEGSDRKPVGSATISLESLLVRVEKYDTIAFDFFDTLVTRHVANPDSLLQYIGYRVAGTFPECQDFFVRRKRGEALARQVKAMRGDVGLDEIYLHFPNDPPWRQDIVAHARAMEGAIETDFLFPRHDMIAALRSIRSLGKHIIVVSDSYVPAINIEDVLSTFKVRDCIDAVYISSSEQARKDTGALWQLVARHEVGRRILAIGDNPHSDRDMAEQVGIAAQLIPTPSAVLAAAGIEHQPGRDWRSDILLGPLYSRIGNPTLAGNDLVGADPESFGYAVLGPALAAFFGWLTRTVRQSRIESLGFLAREGYFLLKFYEHLQQLPWFRDLPPAKYLLLSRRAIVTATLDQDFDVQRLLAAGGFHGSVAEFLAARFGFSIDDPMTLKSEVRLPRDEAFLAKIIHLLELPLREQSRRERSALLSYLGETGIFTCRRVGIVDIGYAGTIQCGLQKLIGRPLVGLYMVASPRADRVRRDGGLAFGCFQDGLYHDLRPDGFMSKTVLLEALLTAPHGQVSHFSQASDGHAVPVFCPAGLSQSKFPILEQVFAGALSYAETLLKAGGAEALEVAGRARSAALVGVEAVTSRQMPVGPMLSNSLFLEDSFSGNGELRCIA